MHDFIRMHRRRVIKISGVNANELKTKARFTEIKKTRANEIHVEGSLYLHDCEDIIEKVVVTGIVYLYRCRKIDVVVAKKVRIIMPPGENSISLRYKKVVALEEIQNHFLINKPQEDSILRISNCATSFMLHDDYKTVKLTGDCSGVPRITFQGNKYPAEERRVIVKKGAIFHGEVIGGQLIVKKK